jgi:signal peptidase II
VSAAARPWAALAGFLCAAVVAADQAIKAAIEAHLVPGEEVDVLGPLGLTLAHNKGVAFGLAGGAGVGLVLITAAALALIAFVFSRDPAKPGMWIATGLLAGGALGNLIDRLAAGEVTDYIDIGSWPAFNLADVAITAGVVLMVLIYLRDAEAADGDD